MENEVTAHQFAPEFLQPSTFERDSSVPLFPGLPGAAVIARAPVYRFKLNCTIQIGLRTFGFRAHAYRDDRLLRLTLCHGRGDRRAVLFGRNPDTVTYHGGMLRDMLGEKLRFQKSAAWFDKWRAEE